MTHRQFRKQLEGLGWSMSEAARQLGVPSGKSRVSEWARGIRAIPPYIVAHMSTIKELGAARLELAGHLGKPSSRPARKKKIPPKV